PPGNWISYPPANRQRGTIHPRHAYWWGRPFLAAYRHTREKKYLECGWRAAEWYQKAMRPDGGLFRNTYLDFSTDSFGQATSGIACAVILWLEADNLLAQPHFSQEIAKATSYLLGMQFLTPGDKDLTGCILEKVLPPDGTDRSRYHIRDLGTIFFVQAMAKLLNTLKVNPHWYKLKDLEPRRKNSSQILFTRF
ncbi:MAG: hypothetical protein NC823_01720, partial [Candidatus Omnitrophica bacterium]|nr:hypothetical protein [Candidatus Omnitrophota bacterium]